LDILRSIGCSVSISGDDVVVETTSESVLQSIDVSMTDCSDLVPAVAVALAALDGESRITGVGFIRNKESDRLGDLASEMSTCGADVHVDEDGLTIQGHRAVALSEVDTHHDHRLAMALSLFALRNEKVVVRDADVVTKSWPSYFEDMKAILTAPNQQK
jgi:3-phosphoshikimate 1-carboxyvinyltransferase